jgi:hypothetical protein
MVKSRMTIDHDEIRHWAEERRARPATVRGTEEREGPGLLRFDFEDYGAGEGTLEPISWDEFFRKFEESHLALVYQDETDSGGTSRFAKFVLRQ